MEYERIHETKMGAISPTKLRMKILGANNYIRKEGGSSSSRASPSKKETSENAKNLLLAGDPDEECYVETKDVGGSKNIICQVHQSCNAGSLIAPLKHLEEEATFHDGGAHENGIFGHSSFEFHQTQGNVISALHRQAPSKWVDAEKWIVSRQTPHPSLPQQPPVLKRSNSQNHGCRPVMAAVNWVKVAPESMATNQRQSVAQEAETKRVVSSQSMVEKFAVGESTSSTSSHKCVNHQEPSTLIKSPVVPVVQSVTMRDIGTEMTPVPSQEPSRTGTPIAATTPSMPSTPRRGIPARLSIGSAATDDELDPQDRSRTPAELSERELQLKTRREIAALGIQLGKMNIASWASKEDIDRASSCAVVLDAEKLAKIENEARAVAWEDAEKSKHIARYRREEVKLQAWESHERARIESAMRKSEVKAERVRGQAKEKMVGKLATMRQKVDDRRAAAEARMSRQAAKTARQARRIRETGRIPSSRLPWCFIGFFNNNDP